MVVSSPDLQSGGTGFGFQQCLNYMLGTCQTKAIVSGLGNWYQFLLELLESCLCFELHCFTFQHITSSAFNFVFTHLNKILLSFVISQLLQYDPL